MVTHPSIEKIEGWGTRVVCKLKIPKRLGWAPAGGARVVYLYGGEDLPIFLITVYAKSEKGNLSKAEQNALAKMAKSFFADYRGKR